MQPSRGSTSPVGMGNVETSNFVSLKSNYHNQAKLYRYDLLWHSLFHLMFDRFGRSAQNSQYKKDMESFNCQMVVVLARWCIRYLPIRFC